LSQCRWLCRLYHSGALMMVERDEADELPEAADAITSAISSLIVAVMEATETGSPERPAAMNEVLAAADRAGMGDGDDGENGDLILSIPNTLISPLFLNHRIRARGDRDKRAISPFSPSPPSACRQLLGSFLSGLR
jgi:hypothetical protein